jgi:RNA recognition motif-containing protein
MAQPGGNKVFCGGISFRIDESDLAAFFEENYGPVRECKIITDRETGKSKGYGFVTFVDLETANYVKGSGTIFFSGKTMTVSGAAGRTKSSSKQSELSSSKRVQQVGVFIP